MLLTVSLQDELRHGLLERKMDYASAIAIDSDLIELMAKKNYAAAMEHLKAIHKKFKADSLAFLIADANGIMRADITHNSVYIDISGRSYFQ